MKKDNVTAYHDGCGGGTLSPIERDLQKVFDEAPDGFRPSENVLGFEAW